MLAIRNQKSEIRNGFLRASAVFLMLPGVLLPGCGGSGLSLGTVSGKVTCQGKPVTVGTVVFVPEKGPSASGALDANGRYALSTKSPGDGAVVGKHRVIVSPPTKGLPLEPGKRPSPRTVVKPISNIPLKFQNVKTSGLSADVRPGNNAFDFDLVP